MTNFHIPPPQEPLPNTAWQEKKAKRKKLLDEIRRRRAERYKQFLRKRYNARQVQQALARSAGIFSEIDRTQLLTDIRKQRVQEHHRLA